jgi:hypothetical protein
LSSPTDRRIGSSVWCEMDRMTCTSPEGTSKKQGRKGIMRRHLSDGRLFFLQEEGMLLWLGFARGRDSPGI